MATGVNAAAEPMTALYVGDIDASVTEEELRRLFDQAGVVDSVKICIDQITERPLGYGYVNFRDPRHAAKALEDLNFTPLNGKSIRISYAIRDASLRRSGSGNVFVKNLDKAIDNKELRRIFSPFGDIISSKIETDDSGNSRGYGFVHYNSEEAARKAIEQLNGKLIHGKGLYVAPFISKLQGQDADPTKFTNVFVKNLALHTTEEDLKAIFGEFGLTTSVAVMRDENGYSKCFGFVNFESPDAAAKSVEVLNGKIFQGKEWYVGRAQRKSDRERELKLKHEQIANEAQDSTVCLRNLYIKNLDDSIDDEKLEELFSPFGTVKSCKVMRDPKGISKGSGFLAFSTNQEASKAISEMHGRMIGGKPLYVAIAERKEDRKARLEAMFSNMVSPPVTPRMPMHPLGGSGRGQQFFYPQAPAPILPPMTFQPPFGHLQQMAPGVRPTGTPTANPFLPLFRQGPFPGAMYPLTNFVQPGLLPLPMMPQQMHSRGNMYHVPAPGYVVPTLPTQATSRAAGPNAQQSGPSRVHDKKLSRPALASALSNASPADQKTMWGENLYPLVEKLEPDMAAKLTGMLLKMDQAEVLNLLESPQSLKAKVMEAKEVLKNAPQQQNTSTGTSTSTSSATEQLASLRLE